ncbi:MAG: glycosyltransferase, partial [Leptolyngbyaceae cyanobacterium SM2_3_12]|nr:glycosyltransferase [Leptolyngbyaceae cyanobacterium SM2_3_12]
MNPSLVYNSAPAPPVLQDNIDISVVVPIYNEYESLPVLVEAIMQVLKTMALSYEVICVDDGSTDGSGQQLRQLSQ